MAIKEYILENIFSKKPEYGCNLPSQTKGNIKYLTQSELDCNYHQISKWLNNSEEISKFILKKDDFLMSRAGTIKSYYYNENEPLIFAGYLVRYNFKKDILLHRYFYYWTKSLYGKKIIDNISKTGTTMPKLNPPIFQKIKVNLPDLQTQQEIINIIEPFEKLRKQINNKKELISKIYFFEIINGKPQKTMIENEIIFEKGKNINSIDLVNNVTNLPFINVSAINNKINKFISSPYIKKNVEYGDVILSLDGTIGLVNNFLEGYNGYGYKVFSKNNVIDNSIIYFSLLNPINQKIIFENSNGSVIKHASKSKNKILLFDFLNENLIRIIFKYDIVLKMINKNINKVIEKLINLFIF